MTDKNYPKWIDEYAKAFHNGFMNMMPCSWGPIDAYVLLSFLNGAFLAKVQEAVKKVKVQKYSMEEIAQCFPSLSSLRIALYCLFYEYQVSNPKDREQLKEIAEFLVEVICYMAKRDTFGYNSNIVHSPQEINTILKTTQWAEGESTLARELGKLYNSLSSLVFALYRDFFPQDSHEIYGPYDVSKKFGENAILVIKYFPKIKPVELWPETNILKHKEVKILQVYRDVKFRCEIVGMHSIYEGDVINSLIKYAVLVDGEYRNNIEDIKSLSDYFAEAAIKYSTIDEKLSKEELKIKMLEWECYQFVNFFKLARMDWRPTKKMLEAIKDKDVPDRYECEEFPPFEKYITSPDFEVYWLKDLYKKRG